MRVPADVIPHNQSESPMSLEQQGKVKCLGDLERDALFKEPQFLWQVTTLYSSRWLLNILNWSNVLSNKAGKKTDRGVLIKLELQTSLLKLHIDFKLEVYCCQSWRFLWWKLSRDTINKLYLHTLEDTFTLQESWKKVWGQMRSSSSISKIFCHKLHLLWKWVNKYTPGSYNPWTSLLKRDDNMLPDLF